MWNQIFIRTINSNQLCKEARDIITKFQLKAAKRKQLKLTNGKGYAI